MKDKILLRGIVAVSMILSVGLTMTSCQKDLPTEILSHASDKEGAPSLETADFWEPGSVYFKLSKSGNKVSTDQISQNLRSASLRSAGGEVKIEPVFDISGEWAPAMIREGLDRWYKVSFDDEINVQSVINDLGADDEIEIVHGEITLVQADTRFTPMRGGSNNLYPDLNNGFPSFGATEDPLLRKQWHYSNMGLDPDKIFESHADINLFEAWKITTGDPRVIVAIIDSGIDYDHPDLKEAMWTDKDGHHGKNFFADNYELNPSYHGTHVAGTVAARSNNSIGVAGVAGGNGSPNTGVKLMSCQVYDKDDNKGHAKSATSDQYAKAFIWAAQNGAVIANCSWGFAFNKDKDINADIYKQAHSKPGAIIQEGINFFIKYAGNDVNGNPKSDSMMSGGVVIFAAGNDGARDVDIIPSSDPSVIAVGAFNPDFKFSHYSNCGAWVDILAPGGDVSDAFTAKCGILSTVPKSFRKMMLGEYKALKYVHPDYVSESEECYAYANGTSMATPHVAGIAALMVSHFGKRGGFTNEMLKKRLLGAIKPHDHEIRNPLYKGKMGAGYIDAALALRDPEKIAPAQVNKIDIKHLDFYGATIAWSVTGDEDAPTEVAFAYSVYLSEAEIKDFSKPTAVVYTHEKKLGEELSFAFEGLGTDKTYHVAIVASDRNGNKSAPVHASFTTKLNHAPEITNLPSKPFVILDTKPFFVYSFAVEDKDGHEWTFKIPSIPEGAKVERVGNTLNMTVIVNGLHGSYSFVLELEDALKGKQIYEIPFSVVSHAAPSLNQKMKNLFLTENGKEEMVALDNVFRLAPGLTDIIFDAKSNNEEVATVAIKGNNLIVTPHKAGSATITLIGNDGSMKTTASLQVSVAKEGVSDIQALYPIPAHSYLNIVLKSDDETINVIVTSSTGEKLIENKLKVNPSNHEATLEVDRLVPGVYNLIVETSRSKDQRTFIKN